MNQSIDTDKLILRLLDDARLTNEEHDAFLSLNRRLYSAVLLLSPLSPETETAIVQRLLAVTEDAAHNPVPDSCRIMEDRLIMDALAHLP